MNQSPADLIAKCIDKAIAARADALYVADRWRRTSYSVLNRPALADIRDGHVLA